MAKRAKYFQLELAVAKFLKNRVGLDFVRRAWFRTALPLRREMRELWVELDADRGQTVEQVLDLRWETEAEPLLTASDGPVRELDTGRIVTPSGLSQGEVRVATVNDVHQALGEAMERRQRQLGVTEYRWITSRDGRVRPRHRELDKTVHRWDLPPVVDVKTGRRAHPGQDYACRCTASPIIPGLE